VPDTLRRRIEIAYMRRTGAASPRGAQAWFARECGVDAVSVWRWVHRKHPFAGPPAKMLERLEAE
jgi:hypothetical protein